jgi:sigma-B regulation protein RsbU (phosphoserine phosphatase)
VALTGEPCRFEDYNRDLDRHYDVIAYRPEPGQFAVVFADVTEQMQLQQRLRDASEELRVLNATLQTRNEELAAQREELLAQNEELLAAREEALRLHSAQRRVFQRLQQTLVDMPRERPGIHFAHLYHSAPHEARVGGDFYDVFNAKNGQVGLLIGDVSGHGVEATRTALLVKDTIRAFSRRSSQPHLVLRDTNLLLLDQEVAGFVTVFLGFLDPACGRLVFSSAGHPPPLLLEGRQVTPVELVNVPLGAFRDARFRDAEVVIPKGRTLLLFTDGVTEARKGGDLFGEHRLGAAARKFSFASVEKLPTLIFDEVLRFSQGEMSDGAAMLAVRYEGED